jgi:hypothetical protein
LKWRERQRERDRERETERERDRKDRETGVVKTARKESDRDDDAVPFPRNGFEGASPLQRSSSSYQGAFMWPLSFPPFGWRRETL